MRFSVIIPVHNAEDHLQKCLDSIDQQTFEDYEVIVVLDSCTDRSAAIASTYADKMITVECQHSGYARNAGIEVAEGEYLLFMDDDDWWLHEYVFEQIDKKLKETNPDILYFSFIIRGLRYHNCEGEYKHLPAFWNKAWRREFVKDLRVEGEDAYMGDVEFQDKAFALNPKIVEWNMPMYYYNYMRPGSMSDRKEHR